jgi:hypothetical protein
VYCSRSRSVSERLLGVSSIRIYIDDKKVTTLITPRVERIQISVATPRGHPLDLFNIYIGIYAQAYEVHG